ncbi:MAG: hypothetical protein C0417_01915 [Chlorobiaceae bacterium]|nr:hypothetical protein [Chlorobiaceae bacterium]
MLYLKTLESMRNQKGQFVKGRKETTAEKEKRIKKFTESWVKRKDFIRDIKHPKIYNCWRSFMFTLKGKTIGCSEEWEDYRTFYNDVIDTYKDGFVFTRINKSEPFSRNNFVWLDKEIAYNTKDNTILLTYKNDTKTLKEWSIEYNVTLAGIRLRYHNHKDYTPEEIIFGKKKVKHRSFKSATELEYQKVRDKASKMCSAYKFKDKRKRYEYDLNIEWLIKNILYQRCIYCHSDIHVGCDRVDNNKGHTKDNVVPCCFICNTVRGNYFTFEEMKVLGKEISKLNESRNINGY